MKWLEFPLSVFADNVIFMGRKRRKRNNLKTNTRVSEVSLHIDVAAELDKAPAFHQNRNLQQAEERYRQILKANPQNEDALHFEGILVFQLGQYDTASDLIFQVIKLNPKQSSFFDSLGTVLKAQQDTEKAMKAYYRALEIDPNNLIILVFYYKKLESIRNQSKFYIKQLKLTRNMMRQFIIWDWCYNTREFRRINSSL